MSLDNIKNNNNNNNKTIIIKIKERREMSNKRMWAFVHRQGESIEKLKWKSEGEYEEYEYEELIDPTEGW